jgi:hypothetical protein
MNWQISSAGLAKRTLLTLFSLPRSERIGALKTAGSLVGFPGWPSSLNTVTKGLQDWKRVQAIGQQKKVKK